MSGSLLQMTVKLYVILKSSVKGYVVLVSLPPVKFVNETYETGCLPYQVLWKTERWLKILKMGYTETMLNVWW